MEERIMNRMQEILDQYAELPQMDRYDLTMEAVGDKGDVNVLLKKDGISIEKTIGVNDDLGFISDTFGYPDTITPRSRDFATESVKMAYFSIHGDLMVEHTDGTVEKFKVKPAQRDTIIEKIKLNLGDKVKL
jgi:hypothetical protein